LSSFTASTPREKTEALQALYDHFEPIVRKTIGTPANFIRGAGNPDADVIFVGEAPGLNEDRLRTPFIGRAGQILNGWLEAIGLDRKDVFITNTVKCHPMKNPKTPDARGNDRPPTPAEIALCRPILEEEVRIISPRVIVTLGSPATRTILNTKETITQLRGRRHPFPADASVGVFPIFHPAALCHNPSLKIDVLNDLRSLRQLLTNG
jgi:DNA polymerase